MLSDGQIQSYLKGIEDKLIKSEDKKEIKLSSDWVNEFPSKPGIYVAFEDGNKVYFGETGNIRERMRDLQDSRHHTLRRNIGRHNFSSEIGYEDANTKKKFPRHIEEKIDHWLRERIKISVLPTKLGRKELEEELIKEYDPKYNKRGQRASG
jgi:hypothetical protein